MISSISVFSSYIWRIGGEMITFAKQMRTINTYTIKLKRMKKKNCGCWLPSYAAAS